MSISLKKNLQIKITKYTRKYSKKRDNQKKKINNLEVNLLQVTLENKNRAKYHK